MLGQVRYLVTFYAPNPFICLNVLEKVIARLNVTQEVTEVIGSNGHVRAFLKEKGLAS